MLEPLWPAPGEPIDDLFDHVVERGRHERLMLNMVASVDGQTRVAGSSSPLNDEDDKALFGALRAVSDAVVVGAETARIEGYGPVRLPSSVQAKRRALGLESLPPLVIVSRSLSLDGIPALENPSDRLLVATGESGYERRHDLEASGVEVELAGFDGVEPSRLLSLLKDRGARVVLCEGGPSLNAQLLAASVVDELNLTISPQIVGGGTPSISGGIGAESRIRLVEILKGDRSLFVRYELD